MRDFIAMEGTSVGSDQGSVYTSDERRSFLASHGAVRSMRGRGCLVTDSAA